MTNVKDYFSGNYLKAEDCKGGEIIEFLSIGTLEEIKSPEGDIKEVLNYEVSINGSKKTFTPNKTNGNILMEAFGEDDKNWVGKKCTIELINVNVFGKVKKSIVVKPIVEEKPTKK
jgi:hypothetical protein